MNSLADEMEKLGRLRREGLITKSEYEQAKQSLFEGQNQAKANYDHLLEPVKADANTWGMFIHLSQLCGYLIPVLGWIVPIAIWFLKKDLSPKIDAHGTIVLNWILSELIYGMIFILLSFILIGWPLLILLAGLSFVYPLIGAAKASQGDIWKYPGSLNIIKLQAQTAE